MEEFVRQSSKFIFTLAFNLLVAIIGMSIVNRRALLYPPHIKAAWAIVVFVAVVFGVIGSSPLWVLALGFAGGLTLRQRPKDESKKDT